MKRIMAIFLSLVMIFSCSYTALANITVTTGVKVVNEKGTKDVTLMMKGRYVTDDGVLMLPLLEVLKQTGFKNIEQVEEKSIIAAVRPSDGRNFAFYYKGSLAGQYLFQYNDIQEEHSGNLLVTPTIINGVTMVAAKDLLYLTGDTVRADVSKGAFYIVVNGCENVDTTVASLPTAAAAETAIVVKYGPRKKTNTTTATTTTNANNTGNISVYVNNKKISFDVQPQTINGSTMVPMRAIFEALGAKVTYMAEKKAIVAEKNNEIMVILLNKEIAGVYDKNTSDLKRSIKLNPTARTLNGRTLVPIRAISDGFGYNVSWNNQTKTVSITSPGVTDTVNNKATSSTTTAVKRTIGAPNKLYASCSDSDLFSYVRFGLQSNSVDGITLRWIGQNLTGKTINYYTANITTYDRVGGRAYDEISGKSQFRLKYVGPIPPNGAMVINQLFTYSPACYKATIESFDVEYSDGTSERIEYWYSATH